MSERIKHRNQHIILLVISFLISTLLFAWLNSAETILVREWTSQKRVSPDLSNIHSIHSETVKDELGNTIGETFLYKKDDHIHVIFSSTDEKRIESTYIRLSENLIPESATDSEAQSSDYIKQKNTDQTLEHVIIPVEAINATTHLISAFKLKSTLSAGRYYDGTIVFHPKIIQSIIH